MEQTPKPEEIYENVAFIDEYPELRKKVWLRRLHTQRRMGVIAIYHDPAEVIKFPDPDDSA